MSEREKRLVAMAKSRVSDMPEEQIKEIRKRVREHEEMLARKKADPEVQRKARLFQSWLSLGAILSLLEETVCPICEEPATNNLVFKCHPEMTVECARTETERVRGIENV